MMDNRFFEKPILNSPYAYPQQHWELDEDGQPTQRIIGSRRSVSFITPIPKPKKRKTADSRQWMVLDGNHNDEQTTLRLAPCVGTGLDSG